MAHPRLTRLWVWLTRLTQDSPGGNAPGTGLVQRVGETEHQGERENHRFFLYHLDNNRCAAFYELVDPGEASTETFCAKSDNLDTVCQDALGVLGASPSSGIHLAN